MKLEPKTYICLAHIYHITYMAIPKKSDFMVAYLLQNFICNTLKHAKKDISIPMENDQQQAASSTISAAFLAPFASLSFLPMALALDLKFSLYNNWFKEL